MNGFEMTLNMCGYNSPNDFIVKQDLSDYRRIYLGHEYCSAFLISFEKQLENIISLLGDEISITLVFPVIQEKHWASMERICSAIQHDTRVDEIVINDFGTLDYCAARLSTKKIILGKLFNKLAREARVDLWSHDEIVNKNLLSENIFETDSFRSLMKKYNISRIETELISREYFLDLMSKDSEFSTDIHYPYIYITSGTICPLNCGSSNNKIRFENRETCHGKCKDVILNIKNPIFDRLVINRGNTYMYKTDYEMCEDVIAYESSTKYRLVINKHYGEEK